MKNDNAKKNGYKGNRNRVGSSDFDTRKPNKKYGDKDSREKKYARRDNRSGDVRRDFDARKNVSESVARENRDARSEKMRPENLIIGRNAVSELLKSGRAIDKIFVKKGERTGSITVIAAEAINRGIPLTEVEGPKLDAMAYGGNHQGVIASAAMMEYSTTDDMLALAAERGEKPLIVMADGIEDPQNLGALLRAAEGAGAHGVIIPKRHAVGLTEAVAKSSAGAIEYVPVAKVVNLATTVRELKEKGLWVFAAEAGGTDYSECDTDCPALIIMGSEGSGVSKLLKDISDYIISIPMHGKINSLNVSSAAAVILFDVARKRREKIKK